jgi:hypothetical protein
MSCPATLSYSLHRFLTLDCLSINSCSLNDHCCLSLPPVFSCITNFHSYSHIVSLKRFCQVKLLFQMHATSTLSILRSKQIVYKCGRISPITWQLCQTIAVDQTQCSRPPAIQLGSSQWPWPKTYTFWQVDCVLEWKQKFRLHSYEICTIPFDLKVQFLHYIRYSLIVKFCCHSAKMLNSTWYVLQQLVAALEISSNTKMVKAWKARCVRCIREWKHLDVKEELSRITAFCAHQSSRCTHRARGQANSSVWRCEEFA